MGNVLERANENCKERWKLQDMGLENRESGKTERKESDNSGQIRDVKNGMWLQEKESSATLWKHNSVFQTWGTQMWVGYGCAAQSFEHHPTTKPEKAQNYNLCLNHLFLEGPLFKPIGKLGRIS